MIIILVLKFSNKLPISALVSPAPATNFTILEDVSLGPSPTLEFPREYHLHNSHASS